MILSLTFLIVLILILLPGHIFRRLYYYGEFSKQFNAGQSVVNILALSLVPGILNLLLVSFFYDWIFTDINIASIIDILKDVNASKFRFYNSENTKYLIKATEVVPFVGSLYSSALIFGLVLGRFIRFLRLDTIFKVFRYKNYWFYIFSAECTRIKKFKNIQVKNKKLLFTKADILVDTESGPSLFSGMVVDYELKENDGRTLSKVMLENAERYKTNAAGKKEPLEIPGTVFVVNCSTMININLTYVYKEAQSVLNTKFPYYYNISFSFLYFLIIPLFIFQINSIDWELYTTYFSLRWYAKLNAYLLFVQILSLFNPFLIKNNVSKYTPKGIIITKLIFTVLLFALLYIIA